MSIVELLFGRPLRSDEEASESLSTTTGVPVLGLDALASAAYGPEAALTALLPLGAAASRAIGPVTLAIVVVLAMLGLSYRRTISAYPAGAGAYTVARENLGTWPSLLAASTLELDYVLNVAVAISAGVGALVSAVPSLLPHTLAVCLGILALLAIVNLRGIRTAGLVFVTPTYLFVLCLGATLAAGLWRTVAAHGSPEPLARLPSPGAAPHALGAWLALRAFASGCTAATGVEAVSNAVPLFRKPALVRARRTLTTIVAILLALVLGEAWLARIFDVSATPPGRTGYESVLSQLVGAVAGRGSFYYVTIGAIITVLCLSANTSFAAFPRLCRVLAEDEFLPGPFAHRGRRLVYTAGILWLTAASAVLLIGFQGVTDRLIPLFAVGAFLAFTLSQLGMVFHWRRLRGRHWRKSSTMNAAGAVMTAAALAIMVSSKLTEGAWITVLVVPATLATFWAIRRHFASTDRQLQATGPLPIPKKTRPVVLVPLHRLDRGTRKALGLALQLSPDVQAVQFLTEARDEQEDLTEAWSSLVEAPAAAAGLPPPKLVVIRTKYRELLDPLREHVERLAAAHPDRFVAVLVPQLVEHRWYHYILHSHRASLMKAVMLMRGGPRVVVVNTPWYIDD
jgi:amino acid transporter